MSAAVDSDAGGYSDAQMLKYKALCGVGVVIVAVSLVLLAFSLVIPLKAFAGQKLLAASWEKTLATGEPQVPWPWADFKMGARLSFPRVGRELFTLDQASGEAMAWGPGEVVGTAPLGAPGLAAVAGHRDSHFRFLEQLQEGDVVLVELPDGSSQSYEIKRGDVVDSREWEIPQITSGPSSILLVTCWPFGGNTSGPLRFLWYAEKLIEA